MTKGGQGMKKRALFVDDEPNVLQGLRRMLFELEGEWELVFAQSGEEALERMRETPVDVVVSDMRMPGMDGAELLKRIQSSYPDVVRVVLSGHSEYSKFIEGFKQAHQFLAKPCSEEVLVQTLANAWNLRMILTNPEVKSILGAVNSLPVLPECHNELLSALRDEDASAKRIGAIIKKDVGMTTNVLRMVNSPFFGLRRRILDPAEAVTYLGVTVVECLVLSSHLFAVFDQGRFPEFSLAMLEEHCLATGLLAKAIAGVEGQCKEVVEQCFISGMLHDVGKILLAWGDPSGYSRILDAVRKENKTVVNMEQEELGVTHAESGAYLLGLWSFPGSVVEAVAFHHTPPPSACKGFSILAAVHVANVLEKDLHVVNAGYARNLVDEGYLASAGLTEHVPMWREACARVHPARSEA